jgi:hypothetical protein
MTYPVPSRHAQSDFEYCRIYVELSVFEIPKIQLPSNNDKQDKQRALGNPYFIHLKNILGNQYSTCTVDILL